MRGFARSFSGGELTPEFFGQVADAKFQTGLALCRNFEILPHGPVRNRGGFAYVATGKFSAAKKCRVIPFTYSTTQTMVLELGEFYVRFYTVGATLLSGGVPYEVVTPYAEADLFDIHFVQSSDVLTLVHPNYPPAEIRRLGATNWTYVPISFATTLAPPTGLSATPTLGTTPSTPTTQMYAVTAVAANNIDESLISASTSCSNNLFDAGAFNTIAWGAVTGAKRYSVYRFSNGLWGYIGQAAGTSFVDDAITPNVGLTPPESYLPFGSAGNYPGAVSYYEQRRCFAGTLTAPQTLWLTRSATEYNMTYHIPTQDADSIQFRVVAREANTIRHLLPLNNLLALTSAAEWRITSVNTDALTQTSASVKPQSYIGANNVQPVIVNNNVIFAAARGGHARELAYSYAAMGYAGGFVTGDLSLRACHLFDTFDIVDMTYTKAPHQIVWMVSSSGSLIALTYVPEQQIGSWHHHDTVGGTFESVTAVSEGGEDILYAVVLRMLNGVQVRTIERKQSRALTTLANCFFVDCGATYSGTPASTISGLSWLIGSTVAILADGAVVAPQIVSQAGTITLPNAASVVQVGLPITADLQTLPLAMMVDGYGQGRPKNVNRVYLRVKDSSGIYCGPSFNNLVQFKQRTTEPYGSPPRLITDEVEVVSKAAWTSGGQACVRQSDPLPLTIVSIELDYAIGG